MWNIFKKSTKPLHRETPAEVLQRIEAMITSGRRPSLDTLTPEELSAAGSLIGQGKAKIDKTNCRPILAATLR